MIQAMELTRVNNFFKRITVPRNRSGLSEHLFRRAVITNSISLVTALILVIFGFLCLMYDNIVGCIALHTGAVLSFVPILLNRNSAFSFATFFLLFLVSFIIYFFDGFFGDKSGVFMYFFPILLCVSFVFHSSNRFELFSAYALTAIFFFLSTAYSSPFNLSSEASSGQIISLFQVNSILSILVVGQFLFLINYTNQKQQKSLEQKIEERNKAVEEMKMIVEDKEVLLAEVHHRVKNNLAVISSLLNLQQNNITDDYTRSVLLESSSRVASMSLIHEKLYRSNNVSHIDFGTYIKELVYEIEKSYNNKTKEIQIAVETSEVYLDINNAIPCGLIINELVINCYKHAFIGRVWGKINVSFYKKSDDFYLVVKDNGIGLKNKDEDINASSLGMILITSLSEQLDGDYDFSNEDGTKFTLKFADS